MLANVRRSCYEDEDGRWKSWLCFFSKLKENSLMFQTKTTEKEVTNKYCSSAVHYSQNLTHKHTYIHDTIYMLSHICMCAYIYVNFIAL